MKANADEAVDFLKELRPALWVLTAILPNGRTTTITANTTAEVGQFISKHDGRANIHYTLNPVKTATRKKPNKANIAAAEFVHADCDPLDNETQAQAKERYLKALQAFKLPATAVVDSGNGIQALWRLTNKALPEQFPDVEAVSKAVMLHLGAKPGTQNVDRLMRLPGTTNLPTPKKLRDGRVACEAKLIAFNGAVYPLSVFPKDTVVDNSSSPSADAKLDYGDVIDLIKNGAEKGDRSELFHAVVWHLTSRGYLSEEITEKLAKYPKGIGAKYAGRLQAEVQRSFDKWQVAHIKVVGGELPSVVDQAEQKLLASGSEIYQRGGIVRPAVVPVKASDDRDTLSWRLIPVSEPYLVDVMTRTAAFVRWDSRAKRFVPTDAPSKVAKTYLARVGEWNAPVLAGIVNTPFIRADGSICQQPGYDAQSGLLFNPEGQTFPPIPERPSKADALKALARLERPIKYFPFIAAADRAVALSGILTALDRRSMETAPLHGIDAPVAGTGKSKLVDVASVIASGHEAPVTPQGRDEDELEKRLSAAMLAGDAIISIDNCSRPLQCSFLCMCLTQPRVKIRILGKTEQPIVPSNSAMFATGNGLTLVGDLTRRSLRSSLDAGVERPELREFRFDPVTLAREHRGELVVAGLTLLRAYQVGGERIKVEPFGSFEEWSRRVREGLIWVGCDDPCATVAKVRDDDPERYELAAVLRQWLEHLPLNKPFTVRDLVEYVTSKSRQRIEERAEFKNALLNVAGVGKEIDNRRLGIWLGQHEGRIVDGVRLEPKGERGGSKMWALMEMLKA